MCKRTPNLFLHQKMQNIILSKIKNHEVDFMIAHRTQMYKIQKQMAEIRQATSKQNLRELQDHKIKKLEQEQEFFKNQAFKLDKECKRGDLLLKSMKKNVEQLEDDRDFHQAQLKKMMKINKALENYVTQNEQKLARQIIQDVETKAILYQNGPNNQDVKSGQVLQRQKIGQNHQANDKNAKMMILSSLECDDKELSQKKQQNTNSNFETNNKQLSSSQRSQFGKVSSDNNIKYPASINSNAKDQNLQQLKQIQDEAGQQLKQQNFISFEDSLQKLQQLRKENQLLKAKKQRQVDTIRHLKKSFNAERKITRQLVTSSYTTTGQKDKSKKIKEIFRKSIDMVKQQILLRKEQAEALESKKSKEKFVIGNRIQSDASIKPALLNLKTLNDVPLGSFTAHDKRRVIEEMLNDQETLLFVYKSLANQPDEVQKIRKNTYISSPRKLNSDLPRQTSANLNESRKAQSRAASSYKLSDAENYLDEIQSNTYFNYE